MWIIDDSGPKADVLERVKAITFQSFIDAAKERKADEEAEQRVAKQAGKPLNPQRNRMLVIENVLAALDDWAEAQFERVKTFVIAELGACETSHVGVCARPRPNPLEAPRGGGKHRGEVSISISEFNGE